ncbi:MAG: serine kinase [Synergistales bacterium]
MTVTSLIEALGLDVHHGGNGNVHVSRGVVGDLLSFVMGGAPEGAVWVTLQTHVNIAAVAVLKEIPLVILASGRIPDAELLERCRKEDISIATASDSPFDLCGALHDLGLKG